MARQPRGPPLWEEETQTTRSAGGAGCARGGDGGRRRRRRGPAGGRCGTGGPRGSSQASIERGTGSPPRVCWHGEKELEADHGRSVQERRKLRLLAPMEVEEGGRWDFLNWVGVDTSTSIFRLLDDPADLVRAATVSRSWRQFVIDNEFCKSLCRRICPEVANFTRAVDVSRSQASESSQGTEHSRCVVEHRVYSCLSGKLLSTGPSVDCIRHCIGASSTDRFPIESMINTLEPQDRVNHRPSCWCSGGADDPDVPESLTYSLKSNLCIINEIRIRPFKVYFQQGHPIYPSKAVRIRMGHSKLAPGSQSYLTDDNENLRAIADENYVWTYTSPEFPMLQENVLQSFKLPRPVLCIGGVVKIELLGRVQKQAADDRYYIGISHVQVLGRSLSRDFMVDMSDPAGYLTLKYLPGTANLLAEGIMASDYDAELSGHYSLSSQYRPARNFIRYFRRAA